MIASRRPVGVDILGMFGWRVRRQLVVFLILALLVGWAGFWLYSKFLPEPTCFDNRQNQGELGVDCGGPCESCEVQNPKPLTIFWARAVPVRINTYDVAAEVLNENETLSSANVKYQFTLFDDLAPVAVKAGSTFIFAQEEMHVTEANLVTSREPSRVEFKILDIKWEAGKKEKPNILVERRDYLVSEVDGFPQSVVESDIVNRSFSDFREVEVTFIVLDADGNLMGANKIAVGKLSSGERKTVRSVWPRDLGEPSRIFVEPRVNIFDPDTILRPQ